MPLQDIAEASAAYHRHHNTPAASAPPRDFMARMMQQFPDVKEAADHGTG